MNESRRAALADPQKTKKEARSSEESSGVTERRAREARARERARWKKRANGPLALSQTVATRPATNLEQEPRAKRREEDVQTTAFTLSSLPLYVYLLLPLLFHPCCPLFFFLSPLCFAPINNISQSPLSLSLSLSFSLSASRLPILLFSPRLFFAPARPPLVVLALLRLLLLFRAHHPRLAHPVMRVPSPIINSNLCRTLFFAPLSFHRRLSLQRVFYSRDRRSARLRTTSLFLFFFAREAFHSRRYSPIFVSLANAYKCVQTCE